MQKQLQQNCKIVVCGTAEYKLNIDETDTSPPGVYMVYRWVNHRGVVRDKPVLGRSPCTHYGHTHTPQHGTVAH